MRRAIKLVFHEHRINCPNCGTALIYHLTTATIQLSERIISRSGDIVEAQLGGGQMAHVKLQREPGADGKGVVLKNVKYFGAANNDGFELYRSLDHSANVQGHQFSYSDRNAFLISIDTHEGEGSGMSAGIR